MISEGSLSSNYRDGLPPGYRFKPTDVELLYHLYHKINHGVALMPDIRDVDLYSSDHPRSLTEKYPHLGDREWYFFTRRNRKYPNGGRPDRTAGSGFWRAMVADKQVVHGGDIMGFKRTLVFFSGNHKECVRTSWMMNEFRAEQNPRANTHANDMKLDDWVLCRVYENERRVRGNRQADAPHSSSGAVVMQEDAGVNTQIHQTIDSNVMVVGDMRTLTVSPPQNHHHHHPYLDQTLLYHNNVNTQIEQSIDTNITMVVGEDMRTLATNPAQDYYHPYLDQSQTLLFDNDVNIQGGGGAAAAQNHCHLSLEQNQRVIFYNNVSIQGGGGGGAAAQNHYHPSLDQRVIFYNNVNIQGRGGGGGAAAQNHYHPSLDQRVVFDNDVNHQLAATTTSGGGGGLHINGRGQCMVEGEQVEMGEDLQRQLMMTPTIS